jgi:hypothetical protein
MQERLGVRVAHAGRQQTRRCSIGELRFLSVSMPRIDHSRLKRERHRRRLQNAREKNKQRTRQSARSTESTARAMNLRSCIVLAGLLLTVVGCTRQADVSKPQHFRDEVVSFDYPSNWKITKNEGLRSGRLIFVEAPNSAVVILTVLNPEIDVALDEYANDFKTNLGTAAPFRLVKNSAMSANASGIDCKFSLELVGVKVPHTANITKHVFGDIKVICLTQVADEDRRRVDAGFRLIRRTLGPPASEKPAAAPEPAAGPTPRRTGARRATSWDVMLLWRLQISGVCGAAERTPDSRKP